MATASSPLRPCMLRGLPLYTWAWGREVDGRVGRGEGGEGCERSSVPHTSVSEGKSSSCPELRREFSIFSFSSSHSPSRHCQWCLSASEKVCREGGWEGGREGGEEGLREGERERGREGGREKGRKGGREEGRKGGREGGVKKDKETD